MKSEKYSLIGKVLNLLSKNYQFESYKLQDH